MFMHASAVPNAAASPSLFRGQRRHGLRQAASTQAALATLNHPTPAAGMCANKPTASAAPRYCETAPVMKKLSGGIAPSGVLLAERFVWSSRRGDAFVGTGKRFRFAASGKRRQVLESLQLA
jgi:hypothetical protein